MIFRNPQGAPVLACDSCGCRWFDSMNDICYECATPVPEGALLEFRAVLMAFAQEQPRKQECMADAGSKDSVVLTANKPISDE